MCIVIRYKVYSQQHTRAGANIQDVIYDQLARAGQNSNRQKSEKLILNINVNVNYPESELFL